jgi:hypothetical protein
LGILNVEGIHCKHKYIIIVNKKIFDFLGFFLALGMLAYRSLSIVGDFIDLPLSLAI